MERIWASCKHVGRTDLPSALEACNQVAPGVLVTFAVGLETETKTCLACLMFVFLITDSEKVYSAAQCRPLGLKHFSAA